MAKFILLFFAKKSTLWNIFIIKRHITGWKYKHLLDLFAITKKKKRQHEKIPALLSKKLTSKSNEQ